MSDIPIKIIPGEFKGKRVVIYGNYETCKKIAKEYNKENDFCVSRKCGPVKFPYQCINIAIKANGIDATLIASNKFAKESELYIMPIGGVD